jgi:hypothetical protein
MVVVVYGKMIASQQAHAEVSLAFYPLIWLLCDSARPTA